MSSFADLQGHVADKAVTNDHFHAAIVKIAAFHVADKIHGELLEQRQRFARQLIPLVFFLADGEQPDAGPLHPEDDAVVGFAHHRKFHQVMRLAIHVRAHVEQHGGRALGGGENLGDGGPVHAFQCPQHDFGGGHHRAGVAGADHAVRLALMHQTRRDADGGIAPLPEGLGGLVPHGDRLAGVDDLDGETLDFALAEFLAETILRSDQQDLRVPARAASIAPSSSASGAESVPMASTAMRRMMVSSNSGIWPAREETIALGQISVGQDLTL